MISYRHIHLYEHWKTSLWKSAYSDTCFSPNSLKPRNASLRATPVICRQGWNEDGNISRIHVDLYTSIDWFKGSNPPPESVSLCELLVVGRFFSLNKCNMMYMYICVRRMREFWASTLLFRTDNWNRFKFKASHGEEAWGTCTSLCLNFQALRQQLHDLREEAFTESKEADLGLLGTGRDSRTFQFDHWSFEKKTLSGLLPLNMLQTVVQQFKETVSPNNMK